MAEPVIVDTSALYALTSSVDQFHSRARQLFEHLLDRKAGLLTNSYVLVETASLIHRRLGFPVLNAFLESLKEVVTVVWVDDSLHEQSWRVMLERQGARLSLVDASVVVLAHNLHAMVFGFDEDFRQEGLVVIS